MAIADTPIDESTSAQALARADAAARTLLENAARRARFFRSPAAWLDAHAGPGTPLLAAYADALARELGEPPGSMPSWLVERGPAQGPSSPATGTSPLTPTTVPLPDPGAREIRMAAVAVVATVAAVVSAAAAVVTAAVAVTNAMSVTTPTPRPVPKQKVL